MRIRPKFSSRRIVADDELEMQEEEFIEEAPAEDEGAAEGGVDVAPEAADLLFEAEDVAELIAEVTGEPVEVTADEDTVVFKVADDEFTVTAEGDEEVLESVRKSFRGKRPVKASERAARSTRRPVAAPRAARPVQASRRPVAPARKPVQASRRVARSSRRISK